MNNAELDAIHVGRQLSDSLFVRSKIAGNEVTHAFMVTEVYIKEGGKWKMGSLTFSTLLRPVKMNSGNSQPTQH